MVNSKFGSIKDVFYTKGDQNILGRFVSDGTLIARKEIAEHNNAYYCFDAVIIWKLFLDLALDSQVKAINAASFFVRTLEKSTRKKQKKYYNLKTNAFDKDLVYFKCVISTYIFSFNALEAYVNSIIDSFTPTQEDYVKLKELSRGLKGGPLLQLKVELIKECSIQEKLLVIIPYILKKKGVHYNISNKEKADFDKILLFVRNELTHYKRLKERSGIKNNSIQTSKLWNKLIPSFDKKDKDLIFHPATFVEKLILNIEKKLYGAF